MARRRYTDKPFEPRQATTPPEISATEARTVAMERGIPTRASLRCLLGLVLRGDSDFDAFCHDYHEEVYRRFTDGMERGRKETLLLKHADRAATLANLYQAHPDRTRQHSNLLEWDQGVVSGRARRGIVRIVALLGATVTVALWCFLRDTIPPVVAFEASARGIVLGGPWMATPEGKELCRELHDLDARHAVRCVAFSRDADADTFRDVARAAGASVIAEINSAGVARVSALGRLERDALLGGTLTMDLHRDADQRRAAVVINALARLSQPRPDFEPDTIACPEIGSEQLDPLALLTLLVVPSCQRLKIDSRRFVDACPPSAPELDEICALALYLDAEHNPDRPHVRANLERHRAAGRERFRTAVTLKLAWLDCKAGARDAATSALIELSEEPDPCVRAELPGLAACLAAAVVAPSTSGARSNDPLLDEIERLPIDPHGECPPRMRALALARRGYWRERGGRWVPATEDYDAAFVTHPDPRYGLNLAEAWLHRERWSEARGVLAGLGDLPLDPPDYRARAALLRWIAARQARAPGDQKAAEATLLDLHASLPPGTTALAAPDDERLRALACDVPESAHCVYNVLRRRSSRDELVRSFGSR